MTSDQLSELIAKAPKMGDWVVAKLVTEPLFYRPDSRGYTSALLAAGTFPEEEAKAIAKNASYVVAAQVGINEEFERLLQRVGYHGLAELAAIQELGRLRRIIKDIGPWVSASITGASCKEYKAVAEALLEESVKLEEKT
jgi:hypothetical protein